MKFGKDEIGTFFLKLYVIAIIFSNNTYIFYGTTFAYLVVELFICLKQGIRIGFTTIQYIIFIIYLLLSTIMGFTFYPNIALKRCLILTANLVINALIANQLYETEKRRYFLIFYVKVALIFETYLLVLSGSNILRGRLGEYAYSLLAYDKAYNSNMVGLILTLAVLCNMYFLIDESCNVAWRIVFLSAGILLTGSRKAIIITALILIIYPILKFRKINKATYNQMLKYVFIGIVIVIVSTFLIIKIPVLYNIAGHRIEAMFDSSVDTSLKFRRLFIECAKDYFLTHKVFGIGIDNFAQVNIVKGFYAHNNYWELLVGSGIIGTVLFYLIYLRLFIKLLKGYKYNLIHNDIFLLFILILVLIDFQMVTYLERLVLLFLFLADSVTYQKYVKIIRRV